jgi:hypothetical protein
MPCPLLIVTQVTHGYLTPLTLQPLDQHLLALHLIHGTVEQRILVLLLLLTNLPLDCVAPTGGYTLGIFRCRTQVISPVSVLMVNRRLSPSQSHEDRFSRPPLPFWQESFSRNLTGDSRASTSTCFEPWHGPLRLSRMTGTPDRLRRRRRA